MIHRLFFAQNRMMGAPPGTYEVTFTVKEFFIDPDNAFADTEVGVLQYMTVKIGATEVLTNASGQAVFYLAAGAHTYEVYDNDRYLTTVKGEVTVVASAESVTAKVYACLYKPTEIATLISTDSYIPVSTADNLNDLRTAASRTMGQGTIFEGMFTTGLDKNYIQVLNIDLTSIVNFETIGNFNSTRFSGEYNGNELYIDNLSITELSAVKQAMFCCPLNGTSVLENIRVINASVNSTTVNCSGLNYTISGSGSRITNCWFYGNVSGAGDNVGGISGGIAGSAVVSDCVFSGTITGSSNNVGGIAGRWYSTGNQINNCLVIDSEINGVNYTGGICGGGDDGPNYINDCVVENTDINAGGLVGGIIGRSRLGSGVENSSFNGTVNATGQGFTGQGGVGGIAGQLVSSGSYIKKCFSKGSVSSVYKGVGGIAGFLTTSGSLIENSNSWCSVTCSATHAGGLIGEIQTAGAVLRYSYSIGAVSGTGNLGGNVGANSGTITNCYYDSQTSGMSDTGKGLPRTTAQMKYGTASSFINPDGSTDATEDPANAMYTSWDDVDTWDFGTTSEYPKLK